MFNYRAIVLACILLPAFVSAGSASPPLESIQKTVVDGYGRIDKLSISCLVYERIVGSEGQLALGTVEYRFDRATKQLAIGNEGVPALLVKNKTLFVLAFRDENEVPTYLKIEKTAAINSRDVAVALQTVRAKCSLAEPPVCNCSACFASPFLDGGMDSLFSPATKVASDVDPKQALIFQLGHPDSPVFVVDDKSRPKLDPRKSPLCITTKDGSSIWAYAFDRAAGTMIAAYGEVGSEEATGIPGRRVEILLRQTVPFLNEKSADPKQVSYELPEGAKQVGVADLRALYLHELRRTIETEKLVERVQEAQKSRQAAAERESTLASRIAQNRSTGHADPKQLEKDEQEFAELQAERAGIEFVAKALQSAIDELHSGTKSSKSIRQ